MYDRSAAYYDLIYRDLKDYRDEAAKIDALLQRLSPIPHRLLDAGCGTGEHARRLCRDHGYAVDGLDIEPEFASIAQTKNPSGSFRVGDMRDFDLKRSYDAILCLFSSIGYTETLQGLANAFTCFARHLPPGGWLVCEPWITPDAWRDGQVDSVTALDPKSGETITRTRMGETDGLVSVLKIDYDIEDDASFRQFSEIHRLGLFTREQMRSALEAAGFQVTWLPMGLQSDSLIVAQKMG
ncbi:class I SAM-dependent methyltransferase [Pelagicoccus sp. NFK12]|uniref:Class I SAM-dependent methyltransferase n=1 Tax=Pelagicoccus enzymogenes TaxID=2773457 RepID=A0A927IGB7_9BACT|nr:class I SAM-dependent methyltransferase [Pelagicoccus enzymogenes]MBD5778634.1 class I SAM-dependent methyltransferase [Pelagicoccus enzymogenes]